MAEASFITIILFFVYTGGLGYSATYFFKRPEDVIERNVMRIGIGLGLMPIIIAILSFLGLPVDWRIFLVLSVAMPLFVLLRNVAKRRLGQPGMQKLTPKFSISMSKKHIHFIIVLLLFAGTIYMYSGGAFGYPWFEDDDPWSHTGGIAYVKYTGKVTDPIDGENIFPYLGRNYPPAYDGIFGMLHQTSPYRMWTVKFFNSFIISLGIVFFYVFARRLMKSSTKALFATFALAAIPSYLSHFIWAHALVPTLLFPFLYCISRIQDEKNYAWLCSFLYAGFLVIQPGQAIKVGIIAGLYILVLSVRNWSFLRNLVYIHVLGGIISLTWWAKHAGFLLSARLGEAASAAGEAAAASGISSSSSSQSLFGNIGILLVRMFPPASGTATRPYTFDDFFVAKGTNMINNPTGVGVVLYLLLFAFMLFMFIYLVQQVLTHSKKSGGAMTPIMPTMRYAIIAALIGEGISIGMLAVRYVSVVFGSPVLTSLRIDLWAMLFLTLSFGLFFIANRTEGKRQWLMAAVLWLLFTFLGINSLTFDLPVGLMGFRFWMLFAIPASLLAAEGAWMLSSFTRRAGLPRVLILAGLIVLIILTSGVAKYRLNTSVWGPGATLIGSGQTEDYIQLKGLPLETKVFTFERPHRLRVLSLDKFSCEWCADVIAFRAKTINLSVDEIHSFLRSKEYEYVIGGSQYVRDYGEAGAAKLNEVAASDHFSMVYSSETALIMKVN